MTSHKNLLVPPQFNILEEEKSLLALLANFPDVKAKLIEALETNHFLITISCQLKHRPQDKHDLQHFWRQQNYPNQDVVNTLSQLRRDFIAKKMPTALPDALGQGMI